MTSTTMLMCSLDDLRQLIGEAISRPSGAMPSIEVIDRAELCKRLNITEQTAIRWERKGKIPCFRIGGAVRYNYPKVIESLEDASKLRVA